LLIDSFIFENQLNILRGRLEYLYDLVDIFVIVESNLDLYGNAKSMNFFNNKHLYKKYEDKIVYLPVILNPSEKKNIENILRNSVDQVLHNFKDDDLILIGNIEEIPNKSGINLAKNHINGARLIAFNQKNYYGNFEKTSQKEHSGTVLTIVKDVLEKKAEYFRSKKDDISKIISGGWHLVQWCTSNQENKILILDREIIECDKNTVDDVIYKIFHIYQNLSLSKNLSVIIPTMWKSDTFLDMLSKIIDNKFIKEVIIINNDVSLTPNHLVLQNKKIKLIDTVYNMFVNPAWNYGASIAKYENLLFLSDDIVFDEKVIDLAMEHITPTKIIVLDVPIYNIDNISDQSVSIVHFKDFPEAHNFGAFIMISKEDWYPIPAGLNIYYGDMWMWDRIKKQYGENYVIKNAKVHSKDGLTANTLFNRNEIYLQETDIVRISWDNLLTDSLLNFDNKKWVK